MTARTRYFLNLFCLISSILYVTYIFFRPKILIFICIYRVLFVIWYRHYTWSPISSEIQDSKLEVSILRSVFWVVFLWDRRPPVEGSLSHYSPRVFTNSRWLALGFLNHQQEDWGASSLTHLSMLLDCWTTCPAWMIPGSGWAPWWSDQWVYYLFNGILGGGFKFFFLMFTPIWGRLYNPFWRTYFSHGLLQSPLQGYYLGW